MALEVYKTLCTLTQSLCGMGFTTNPTPCNFRKRIRLSILPDEPVNFGSLSWNNLPLRLTNSQIIDEFKFERKNFGKIYCTSVIVIFVCFYILRDTELIQEVFVIPYHIYFFS